jgi:hypothetical protein
MLTTEEPLDNRLFTYLSSTKITTPFEPVQITFNGEFLDSTRSHNKDSFLDLINNASIVTSTVARKEARVGEDNEREKRKQRKRSRGEEGPVEPTVLVQIHRVNEIKVGEKTYKLPENLPPTVLNRYIMNDREQFIKFIDQFMKRTYQDEIEQDDEVTCDNLFSRGGPEFSLLTHQKIVKDYMNLFTPYRGLLLYHGLGSGKTCTSIAIAEGMKSSKRIIVMVPASLRESYLSELKKCGDIMYRKDKHWDWISVYDTKRKTYNDELSNSLSAVLGIDPQKIKRRKGAFLIDITRNTSNYASFTEEQQKLLKDQIDLMIANKYTFISYNGLRKQTYLGLPRPLGQTNLFDNSVVIIDEGHNLVSRIVNKLDFKEEYQETEDEITPMELKEFIGSSRNYGICASTKMETCA